MAFADDLISIAFPFVESGVFVAAGDIGIQFRIGGLSGTSAYVPALLYINTSCHIASPHKSAVGLPG